MTQNTTTHRGDKILGSDTALVGQETFHSVKAWQIFGKDGEPLFIQQDEQSAKRYQAAGHLVKQLGFAQPSQVRCQYCDGTGDVHTPTGDWRGECDQCDAKQPNQARKSVACVADAPPDDVDVAWLRLGSSHPDHPEDGYVVLGCRSVDEGIWCIAADWKAESHNDPIEDYITHWMPYAVPSSLV